MQRMSGYIRIALILLLGVAIGMPYGEAVVSAAPDHGSESVESYFKSEETEKKSEKTDETGNSHNSETNKAEMSNSNVGVTFGDIFRMFFALLFVSSLLYVLFRIINKKKQGYQRGQQIQNMGGAPLGGDRSVQMVRIGNKIYILGVADSIQLLNVIEDEKEYGEFMEAHNEKLDQQVAPKDMISNLLDKWRQLKSDRKASSSFSSHLQDELDHLKEDRQRLIKEISKKGTRRDE